MYRLRSTSHPSFFCTKVICTSFCWYQQNDVQITMVSYILRIFLFLLLFIFAFSISKIPTILDIIFRSIAPILWAFGWCYTILGILICTLISENQGLQKLRSVSNLRKISGPAHLIFFSVDLNFFLFVNWIFFRFVP